METCLVPGEGTGPGAGFQQENGEVRGERGGRLKIEWQRSASEERKVAPIVQGVHSYRCFSLFEASSWMAEFLRNEF